MNHRRRPFALLVIAVATMLVSAIPALAAQAPGGIDDPKGDPNAPGVNVIRKVDATNTVVVRLNKGFRQAHFSIRVRGVEVVAIDDQFRRLNGVEDDEVGVWGGCDDELITEFPPGTNPRRVADAKFYTCRQHDSIRLYLGEPDPPSPSGSFPAIRIVFTDDVLVDTEGVFVGNDPANVGDGWIPLYGG
jgi:hypothetical protein